MNARTLVVICCAGIMLAGCGGRNASPLPNAAGNLLDPAVRAQTETPVKTASGKSAKATLTVVVAVVHSTTPAPRYISAATKGITLSFKGPEKRRETFGLTHASDSHCRDANRVTTCAFKLQVSTGAYTANVAMFDLPPVNGHIPTTAKLLSTATQVPFMVKSGKVNRLKFKPEGVIASLAISGVPGATAGAAFASAQTFVVTAKDADDYVIVGPYETAVTLADSDTTGATTVATSGLDGPPTGELLSSGNVATLNYTGLAIVPATITASATGATAGRGTFTTVLQPIVIKTTDALNPSYVGVDLYATSGAGSTATFTASELGWTNAPYNKTLSASTATGCSTIATMPTSGTSFTATVASSPSAGNCAATIRDPFGQTQAVTLAYTSFSYTGAQQTINIPPGVTQITDDTVGAAGGTGCSDMGVPANAAGLGEEVKGTLAVTPSEPLYVFVGGSPAAQAGGCTPSGRASYSVAGFNGGGSAVADGGGGGGGGSDVRTGSGSMDWSTRLIVAAGGGGAAGFFPGNVGGNAGPATPTGAGQPGTCDGIVGLACAGGGGTQSSGGAAGTPLTGDNGVDGNAGVPGVGGNSAFADGAGGGGYFGGGSGGADTTVNTNGGGGGGSSYVGSATNVTNSQATPNRCDANNNGCITIIY